VVKDSNYKYQIASTKFQFCHPELVEGLISSAKFLMSKGKGPVIAYWFRVYEIASQWLNINYAFCLYIFQTETRN